MKLAVVGAGSTYTPELVSTLSRLGTADLALHDIETPLGIVNDRY